MLMAEISRNLSRAPGTIDPGVRQRSRVPRQNYNGGQFQRDDVRVIEQTDSMLARERYELAKLKADLLAQQLFEAKVQQSITEEKLAAGMRIAQVDSAISKAQIEGDEPINPKIFINKRIEAMVEDLTSLQSDMPVRNEPLFVNVII